MKPRVYVLRWFNGTIGKDYFSKIGGGYSSQKNAARFGSPEEALASVSSIGHFGSFGKHDTNGWKFVRLVKKVAK